MRITAITNQKGGSGKTTTAVNLAAALGELKRRVLVVDLDPQASASAWLGHPPAAAGAESDRGLLDVFLGNRNLSSLVSETPVPGVALVPGSTWLVGVEKALAGDVGTETLFRRALGTLPPAAYDHVLLDCPPSLSYLAVAALVAAREVLVPVEAHVMALAGLKALQATVDLVRERLNPKLTITAILACRVDRRTNLSRDVVASLREKFGAQVLTTTIRENVSLAEAPSHAQPITTYAPTSSGAEDYRAAARELVRRWKGKR